jgi:hypothetical protein
MMLGHPETLVAKPLDMAGKVRGAAKRLTGIATLSYRGQVQDGEWQHLKDVGLAAGHSR